MGQEPNIPIGIEDLPRATFEPPAERRWRPSRPGEVGSPSEMPWGGSFGTPGPDIGFAIKIVRGRELPGPEHLRTDVEAAVVAVMAARASALGRAPTAPDLDVALDLLGLADEAAAVTLRGIGHDHRRLGELLASIPRDQLTRI